MQTVLSIDATGETAQALVIQIEGSEVSVVERHSFPSSAIVSATSARLVSPLEQPVEGETLSESGGESGKSNEWVLEAPTNGFHHTGPISSSSLHQAISQIKTPWTNAILFIPSFNYVSLNLDLPFGDAKSLGKIVNMEVQDIVPFDVDDFLLDHRSVGNVSDTVFDVHVGILPKKYIQSIISSCKSSEFEPLVISTPSTALEALYHLRPEALASNAIVIYSKDGWTYLATFIGWRLRIDRAVNLGSLDSPEAVSRLIAEAKITLGSSEARYESQIEAIYLLGDALPKEQLEKELKKEIRNIELRDFVRADTSQGEIAILGALFAQDYPAPQAFTNFRTKEFAYSPKLGELIRGFRELLPYLGAVLVLMTITLGIIYGLRQSKIHSLRSSIHSQIKSVVPGITLEDGTEVDQISKQNDTLDQLLKNLGTISASSPLDVFLAVSEDLPTADNIDLKRVSIKGNKLSIDGTAPDYATVEKIEKSLKKRQAMFCKIDKDSPSSGQRDNLREFNFTIRLCE